MLVLSRKKNQNLCFPNLGISVEILRIEGKTVRVGVDAPREISVIRGELESKHLQSKDALASNSVAGDPEKPAEQVDEEARKQRHEFRNKLHTANLALHLLQKQLDAGKFVDAEETLTQALQSFTELDQQASQQGIPVNGGAEIGQDGVVRRALVVEDQANERALLAGYLQLCGYQVDSVEDGIAALDYLATHDHPDIVLLDMQMPRMNGPKTISAIRKNPDFCGIKLFAVSGSEQSEMAVPTGKRGVDRWFAKPLNPAEFADELATEINRECVVA